MKSSTLEQGDPSSLQTIVASSTALAETISQDWETLVRKYSFVPSVQCDDNRFLVEAALPDRLTPHIVLFRDANGPRGLIVGRIIDKPMYSRVGYAKIRLANLRCFAVSHCGIITDGSPDPADSILAYIRKMQHTGAYDYILINHLPRKHPLFERICRLGPHSVEPDVHWRFKLGKTYEDSVSHFSSKHRGNLRRADKNLCARFEGRVQLRVWQRTDEVDDFCRIAGEIVAQGYQGALGVGFSNSAFWRDILKAESERGRMRCYTLECDNKSVAFQAGVIHSNVYMLEETAFLPQYREFSPGQVLLVRVIRDLCEQGVQWVDHGFGDADYKRTFGTECIDEVTLGFYSSSFKPRLVRIISSGMQSVIRPAEWALKRAGLAGRIRTAWRKRLERPAESRPAK